MPLWRPVSPTRICRALFPIKRGRKHSQYNTQTLDFSVTVMKCHKTSNMEQNFSSLNCLWRNWRRKPIFPGWNSFFCAPHFLLWLIFKLSVYVKNWVANCSTDLLQAICRAGFSSVSTVTLKDCTLLTEQRGKGESSLCSHFMSKHVRSQTT